VEENVANQTVSGSHPLPLYGCQLEPKQKKKKTIIQVWNGMMVLTV